MRKALYAHEKLKPLWRIADWAYTDVTPLWLMSGDGAVCDFLHSANSMRHDCWLGALLFAVSMKEGFNETQMTNPKVKMVTILDELYFLIKQSD